MVLSQRRMQVLVTYVRETVQKCDLGQSFFRLIEEHLDGQLDSLVP